MTTPGPWAVSPTKRPQGYPLVVISAQGLQVAAVNASPEDAALMAAAPALLAALQKLVRAIDRLPGNNPLDGLADEARAAIANAKGGQP